jgi:hypothetical protein
VPTLAPERDIWDFLKAIATGLLPADLMAEPDSDLNRGPAVYETGQVVFVAGQAVPPRARKEPASSALYRK